MIDRQRYYGFFDGGRFFLTRHMGISRMNQVAIPARNATRQRLHSSGRVAGGLVENLQMIKRKIKLVPRFNGRCAA